MISHIKRLLPQSLKNCYHFFNALLAVIYHRYPARRLTMIAVTGTDGKTTTSSLIYHLLNTAGHKVALVSTVAAYIGNQQIDTGLHVTSPDPWALQRLISRIAHQGYQYMVLEVTSHGIDQHRVLGCNFHTAIITNVTHEHLDYHGSLDHYQKTKAKLLKRAKFAVLNTCCSSFEALKTIINKRVITYNDQNIPVFVSRRFPEAYNQLNAQGAIAVARLLLIEEAAIEKGITTFPGVIGRMEPVKNNLGIHIIIDFAHTPNALKNALTALKKSTPKGQKLIAVFGAAGQRDRLKRPMMGDIASRLADEIIITAEDPRDENIHTIISQIKAGATTNHGHLHAIPDRQTAINLAIKLAKKGDTVGIFGKGHEQSINLDGLTETPWSDHQSVKTALKIVKTKSKQYNQHL